MTPTAVSQIIEALCKLVVGLALASTFQKMLNDEAMAAAGAILGVSVGCLLGAVYMYFCYRKHARAQPKSNDEPENSGAILATLANCGFRV